MMDTTLDIAWAAGLFEGEGSITHGGEPHRKLKLTLKMTDEDVVRSFAGVLGVGRVYGPYQYKGNRKLVWEWTAVTAQAQAALERLLPYLHSRRRAKAEAEMARRNSGPGKGYRTDLHGPA